MTKLAVTARFSLMRNISEHNVQQKLLVFLPRTWFIEGKIQTIGTANLNMRYLEVAEPQQWARATNWQKFDIDNWQEMEEFYYSVLLLLKQGKQSVLGTTPLKIIYLQGKYNLIIIQLCDSFATVRWSIIGGRISGKYPFSSNEGHCNSHFICPSTRKESFTP